jgi:hypothetical protein
MQVTVSFTSRTKDRAPSSPGPLTAGTTRHFQKSITRYGCRELRKGSICSSCLFSFLDRLTADHAAIRLQPSGYQEA